MFLDMFVMGKTNQHNNKLNKKVIDSRNKFPKTCKNLLGTLIKYKT